jgi:hypothetical protein
LTGKKASSYTISLSKDNNAANKVSQRPEAYRAGERIIKKSYITVNYRLQDGNLQANWYHL